MMIEAKDIQVSRTIPALTKKAYQRALDEFPFLADSSHKNDYAQSKGYRAALLSGYILSGYINQFVVDFFGPDWIKNGEITLNFVRAVHQHDELTIAGVVTGKTQEQNRINLTIDLWMDKADGSRAVTGTASGCFKVG